MRYGHVRLSILVVLGRDGGFVGHFIWMDFGLRFGQDWTLRIISYSCFSFDLTKNDLKKNELMVLSYDTFF